MVKSELRTLTSLRFFSAFMVFLFHIEIRWPLSAPEFFTKIFSQGAIFMSLFFILSGFILTYNYYNLNPSDNYWDFQIRRVARIYPVYFIVGLITFFWINLDASFHLKSILQFIFIIFSNIFVIQAWFPALFQYWDDNGSWSISVEFFCYFLFPLLLLLLVKLPKSQLIKLLLLLYILTILPGLSYVLFDPKPLLATFYAMPIFRLEEFIIGMILGLLFVAKDKIELKNYYFLIATIILFAYLGVFGGKYNGIYIIHNFIVIPAFSVIIYTLAQESKSKFMWLLNNRAIRLLGEASYSFYLFQFIVLKIGYYLANKSLFLTHHWGLAGLLLLMNISLSIMSYFYLEKPCRVWVINRFNKNKFAFQNTYLKPQIS